MNEKNKELEELSQISRSKTQTAVIGARVPLWFKAEVTAAAAKENTSVSEYMSEKLYYVVRRKYVKKSEVSAEQLKGRDKESEELNRLREENKQLNTSLERVRRAVKASSDSNTLLQEENERLESKVQLLEKEMQAMKAMKRANETARKIREKKEKGK